MSDEVRFLSTLPNLASLGIVHPSEPMEAKPWGSREFAILDPDGNCVTFNEQLTPAS